MRLYKRSVQFVQYVSFPCIGTTQQYGKTSAIGLNFRGFITTGQVLNPIASAIQQPTGQVALRFNIDPLHPGVAPQFAQHCQ